MTAVVINPISPFHPQQFSLWRVTHGVRRAGRVSGKAYSLVKMRIDLWTLLAVCCI